MLRKVSLSWWSSVFRMWIALSNSFFLSSSAFLLSSSSPLRTFAFSSTPLLISCTFSAIMSNAFLEADLVIFGGIFAAGQILLCSFPKECCTSQTNHSNQIFKLSRIVPSQLWTNGRCGDAMVFAVQVQLVVKICLRIFRVWFNTVFRKSMSYFPFVIWLYPERGWIRTNRHH